MGMMEIFIPSSGRANRQTTIGNLSPKLYKSIQLVVPKRELKDYAVWGNHVKLVAVPDRIKGIGATRHYIMSMLATSETVAMFDDDLRFDKRRYDDVSKFRPTTMEDTIDMVRALEAGLSAKVPHGSIMCRDGANRFAGDQHNIRMLRVLAYHLPTYHALKINYGKLTIMEDFCTTLALLTAGKPSFTLGQWTQDQTRSGAPGGCSQYRDAAMQERAAHELARLFPDFVKVVEKETKVAWGGGTRSDVMISWKKAYESAGGTK